MKTGQAPIHHHNSQCDLTDKQSHGETVVGHNQETLNIKGKSFSNILKDGSNIHMCQWKAEKFGEIPEQNVVQM